MNLQLSVSVRAKTPTMTHLAPLGSSPPKSINGLSLPVCARNLETQMDRIHLSLPSPLMGCVPILMRTMRIVDESDLLRLNVRTASC